MTWIVELLDEIVEAELRALPRDMLARFQRIVELIESEGLEHVHEPHIKHLEDKLWEMRLKGKDGWHLPRTLRDSSWQAFGGGACLHQEDAEDATQRAVTGT